jgi:tetratricopeptide (TPR) repeat protein
LFPGKYEEALEVLRKALAIQRKTIGPHDETVMTSQEIGKVLEILGRKEEAEEAAKFSKKLIDDKKRIDKAMEDLKI